MPLCRVFLCPAASAFCFFQCKMMLYLFDLKGPETSPLWQHSRFKMDKKKKKLWKMPRLANAVRALWHWRWFRLSYFWTLSMGVQQGTARNCKEQTGTACQENPPCQDERETEPLSKLHRDPHPVCLPRNWLWIFADCRYGVFSVPIGVRSSACSAGQP